MVNETDLFVVHGDIGLGRTLSGGVANTLNVTVTPSQVMDHFKPIFKDMNKQTDEIIKHSKSICNKIDNIETLIKQSVINRAKSISKIRARMEEICVNAFEYEWNEAGRSYIENIDVDDTIARYNLDHAVKMNPLCNPDGSWNAEGRYHMDHILDDNPFYNQDGTLTNSGRFYISDSLEHNPFLRRKSRR